MTARVVEAFEATARRRPHRVALRWEGRALTYERLDRLAGGFARFLHHHGVRAGDRVALAIGNRWTFPVALLGAMKLGATVAPLDARLTAEERAAILRDLEPAAVAHEVVGDEAEWPSQPVETPALILYTSGSTGAPKGALLSQRAVAFGVGSWIDPVMALTADDVVLAVLPLSHSYGLNGALLAPLVAGAQVVLVERFSPEAVTAAVREHGVTVFPGVATMFRRLLEAGRDLEALRRLRLAVAGAAPCPWPLVTEWRERTGVRILRGYGMTEVFRPISYGACEEDDRPDSVGRPVPGVEFRVVDDEGRPLSPGSAGELLIRSPAVMDGYLGAPDETRAVLREGWFRTGDLASVDAEGHVRIEGRKRERILRGGYSVFPPEVEAVLAAHPAVAEAAVVGVPDDDLGEEVVAYVVPRDGARVDVEALLAWCRARLAAFKCPREVRLVPALPRSATGKVLKSALGGR
ncbi:MAG: AMP-binding protein [Candidatus Rokubacteria bacterium]|nr:AMP-binding protein [Candidatus Rokubacteria bacterium]